MPVAELYRKHGVSDASIYKWKAKFGGMEVWEAKRLKTLEDENTKLKRLLAEAASGGCHARQCCFERPFGKEVVTPAAKRRAVTHLAEQHRISSPMGAGSGC